MVGECNLKGESKYLKNYQVLPLIIRFKLNNWTTQMKLKILSLFFLAVSLPSLSNGEGLLSYKPPRTGAPALLTGAGTRSILKDLQVLAPSHAALTGQSQPVLYWYALHPKQKVEVSLFKEGDDEPLLKKKLAVIPQEGLQSISLADYNISLEPGQDYRWSVAVINSKHKNAGDSISSATVRYQLSDSPLSSVEQLAEAGYWYDALQQLIESHSPLANDLLKQVGIHVPAL